MGTINVSTWLQGDLQLYTNLSYKTSMKLLLSTETFWFFPEHVQQTRWVVKPEAETTSP